MVKQPCLIFLVRLIFFISFFVSWISLSPSATLFVPLTILSYFQ
jgi:hypothetical protein